MKWLCLLLFLVAVPMTAQQTNSDIVPATTGLNMGHSNQRWNIFSQNLDITGTCNINGSTCLGGVGSVFGRLGTVTAQTGDYTVAQITGAAPLASPTFTGTVTIPIGASISGFAPLVSPALTGTPTAPTPSTGDNSTNIATTAFVKAQSYAPLASPAFTGTVTMPSGTLAVNSVVPGSNGQCVTTTSGSAAWASCSGVGGTTISRQSGSEFTSGASATTWLTPQNMAANTTYTVDCHGLYSFSAGSDSLVIQLSGPASPTQLSSWALISGAPGTNPTYEQGCGFGGCTAYGNTAVTGPSMSGANGTFEYYTTVVNGSNAGNLNVQVNASSGTHNAVIIRGSFCSVRF